MKTDPLSYDVWFDYTRLEEAAAAGATEGQDDEGSLQRVREVYERAIANVPPADEKRFWRRCVAHVSHTYHTPCTI